MSESPNNTSITRKPRSRGGRKVRETYEKRLIYKVLKKICFAKIKLEQGPLEIKLESDCQVPETPESGSQPCQNSTLKPATPDTDLWYHDLTSLKEFQDFFEASLKRAGALVQFKKITKQGASC